ncbi:tetratricopeptide repeat protein [Pseudomonas cavernicola]|uniref:Tetratricopeptide repeat protein n=1 Tax=Pseudomonas cavernicola TaxID=2320866 RepID=A0A418X978_9PSED|nr:tetratricopeptide repeat protein [Pseudomonas cavernicola]RJG09039.1 tetratricopeptide repeat protein [Pseudomonas cavernicola]
MPKDQPPKIKGQRGAKDNQAKQLAEKKRGLQKKVSSPKATGARGVSFEHRVQAVRLLAMCAEMPCVGVPDNFTIVKLTFQGRVHEHNTDDLVLTIAAPNGDTGTLRMQMKRALTPTTKNGTFEEAIGLAWLDFKQPTFRRGLDTNLIVYQSASAKSMDPAVEVSSMASSSSDAASWEKKVHAEGFSNERNREAYAAIKAAAELFNKAPVTLEELHQFVVHLKFVHHDLDSDSTNEVALQKQILALANVPNSDTGHVWAHLVQACAELNGLGGDVDLATVGRHIGVQLSTQFHTFRVMRKHQQSVQLGLAVHSTEGQGLATPAVGPFLVPGAAARHQEPSYPDAVPAARPSSLNKLVSRHLDSINDLLKVYRYSDAMAQLKMLGQDMKDFDDYQRALWYLLRGMCRWHMDDDATGAADDFIKSATLCDDEDKLAAARIRGHMLKNEVAEAVAAGKEALDRFPDSLVVWVSATNARILNGDKLTQADIPKEHAHQALAWQVVATSQERAGDLAGAFETAKVALTMEEASFFTKEAFLRYALQLAMQNNLNIGFRMLPPEQRAVLHEATAAFADRSKSLWPVQNLRVAAAALTHLGYAYLLTERPQEALALIEEARALGAASDESLFRVEIEALCDLDRPQEALIRVEASLPQLPDDGLLAYAQAAVLARNLEKLDAAWAEGQRRTASPDAERLNRTLRVMRWDLLLRDGRSEELRVEVTVAGVTPASTSITDLVFAARAHRVPGGDKKLAKQYIDRVAELSIDSPEQGETYLGAQLLFHSERYAEAAALYARILPANSFSELHTDLLFCYLRTGQRAKARELLRTMEPAWKLSQDARHMALELSQVAGDWSMVATLAEDEMTADPKRATAWLLRILAAASTEQSNLDTVIGEAPEELLGSVREMAQLASAEIRHGHVMKGLRRLYKAKRTHMGDTEAAALHLTSVLLTDLPLKELEDVPEVVGPGTSVVLTDAQGGQRRLTIDPDGIEGLPATEEFVSPDAPEAKRLFGLHLNDSIKVEDHFGETKTYRVAQLYSSHRRLIEASHNSINTALSPTKYMTALSLPTAEDGAPDLTLIRRQLEKRVEFATQTLDLYKQHPAPLGIIAQRLGCDVIDLVRGWSSNGPKLEVGTGWSQNHDALQELLKTEAVWVVDLTMLTELATLGHLEVLKHLPKVLVSSATRDAVARKLEESSMFRESGTMFSHEGHLGFRENTKEDWHREREFLQTISKATQDHCIIMPAYGPEVVEPNLFRMNKVLSTEEYSTLLLCLEQKASLLTLDDRFQKVAFLFGVRSVWPQELLFYMAANEKIRPLDYSLSVLKMLFWRRTFVSLSVQELTAMMDQGNSWLTIGVNSLRDYLCDPTVQFGSAALVVLNFIGWLYRRGNCELGVVLELVEYLVEPLLRHNSCPAEWIYSSTVYLCWALGFTREDAAECRYVAQFVLRAAARTKHPMKSVAVKATVLYGTVIPWFVAGVLEDEDPAPKEAVQDDKRRSKPEDTPATFATEEPIPGPPEL